MRRAERQIKDPARLDEILRRHCVLYLALPDEPAPYVIPLAYGYDGEALYLHSAPEGRKISLVRQNPRVAFAIEADYELRPADEACHWGLRYESVVGEAEAEILEDFAEKRRGLEILMRQFTDEPLVFSPEAIERTAVIRLRILSLSGKSNP